MAVVQRTASAYSGFPFVIEMGIAYGGKIETRGNVQHVKVLTLKWTKKIEYHF